MVQEIVGSARIDEGAESDRNDRSHQLAWAAGFVDGEGCIMIARATGGRGLVDKGALRYYRICLQVANTERKPLLKLQALFGGTMFEKSVTNSIHRPAYEWRVSAGPARRVLEELLPYLCNKHPQAEIAIKMRRLQEENFKRTEYRLTDGMLHQYEQLRIELMKMHHRTDG